MVRLRLDLMIFKVFSNLSDSMILCMYTIANGLHFCESISRFFGLKFCSLNTKIYLKQMILPMFDYLRVLTGRDANALLLVAENLFMTGILKPTSKYLTCSYRRI